MQRTRRFYSILLPIAVVFLLIAAPALSQENTNLPTRGKRFWTGFMQNGFGAQALRVHILSSTATSGTVSIPLMGWSTPFNVAANNVVVITLPSSVENIGSEAVLDKGVLIESQDSVNVFISSYQNHTHDLSQVLPESSIGDNYRVDAYHGVPYFNNLHKSELMIVGTQDGTEVTITPKVATLGGQPANVPFTVTLDAGQTYQIQAAFDHLDLTGTVVKATESSGACRPFAVIGGSMCATVPGQCSACDMIFEQLVPLSAWGTKYFTAPINGVNASTYRILADEDNTSVTIGGGAPIVLNAGQEHEMNGGNTPVCIEASKPISVVQLLEGINCAGNGDPSMIILSPHDRLSQQASFHTPTSQQINQHSISLVVPQASVGQVTFDGNVLSPSIFLQYAACSDRMHAKLSVSAGVHHVAAPNGFQMYMFGIGSGESYASSVHDIFAEPVVQDSIICGDGTVTLVAPEELVNGQWTAASDPSTVIGTGNSITITPTASDSYTVTGQQANTDCPRTFTFHVGVPLTIPTEATANGASTITVCQYEGVQLGLSPPPDPAWFDILWSPASSLDDPTSPNPIASPTTSTWYKVEITSPTGCGSTIDSVFVQVTPGEVLDMLVTAVPAQICAGNTTNLSSQTLQVIAKDPFDAVPGSMWTAIQAGSVSAVCGSVSGNALYFNGNGQRYAQTIGLNTLGGGQVRFHLKIANGTTPCDDADPGENVLLEYSTSNGASWSLITTYNENAFPEFTPIIIAIPAAAQSNNTMFRIRQLTNSGTGQDNWVLDDMVIARYNNNWLTYQWTPSASVANPNAHSSTATPANSGWYVLHGTDPTAGCVYKDSVEVLVHPAFALQVTPDTTSCAVAGIQLNAQPTIPSPATYSWTPNNGTLSNVSIANPIATPQSTTNYTVNAVNEFGCTASGQVTITVGQLLDLTVNASSTTICQGQQVQLSAIASGANNLIYSWTNGSTLTGQNTASPVGTPTQTTTYTCTVTDNVSGCQLSASITVNVTTGYTANAGPDVSLCSALGHQLNVQHNVPNATYQWSPSGNLNASNIQSPTILYDGTATYTVVIMDANQCSVSDQVVVTRAFEGLPAEIDVEACLNLPPTLTAPQPGVSYSWNTGENTSSITANASGTYTLTITDAQGCQGITTYDVVLHSSPVVDLGPDVSLCGSQNHVLDAGNPGSSFNWNPSGNTQTLTVTASGSYQVTVTNTYGCIASDEVIVQFNALPVDVLQNIGACIETPPQLDAANTGSAFLWNTGAQTQQITATASGVYSVTITTPQNCSATYDAVVTLSPSLQLSLGNDTTICQGTELILDAGSPDASHIWSTSEQSQIITVSEAGSYEVIVSNEYCSAEDMITVHVSPAPTDQLLDMTACIGESLTLDAGNPGAEYAWVTGAASQSIEVSTPGNYTVTVTNSFGCTGEFSSTVQFISPPVVDLGPDTVLCQGEILVLSAGQFSNSWHWNTGATGPSLNVSEAGTYRVVASNGYCARTDSLNVYFNPTPERVPSSSYNTCLEEEPGSIRLDAGNQGSYYLWSTGEVSQIIEADEYGWYTVEITNAFGCELTDTINVVEYCPSLIFAPNTFTPNGDGVNDEFLPVGRNIASMKLMIFDRWGTMIFQGDDMTSGWDGTYNGEIVPNDIFVWHVNYRFFENSDGERGREQEMSGHVQVLR